MAHASFFTKVGGDWWANNIAYQAFNISSGSSGVFNGETFQFEFGSPYGISSQNGSGYAALSESWAVNISDQFVNDDRETGTFWWNYIPVGIYNDLEDDTPTESIPNGYIDEVSGYTRGQLFQNFSANIITLDSYRGALNQTLPSGTTSIQLENLFSAYSQ